MTLDIRLLGSDDDQVLTRVADGVFDHAVDPSLAREFLADARHHMIVAIDGGVVVGMISALHYVHPDKAAQLWINEVGVAPSYHRRGIARQLLDAMLAHGHALGCTEAWLGTEDTNGAANALYRSTGGKPEPFVLYSWELDASGGAAGDDGA
ncbi:MAG TPA: GNAT family N-acetyltransferase [Longimicrobium sp.]|nr:GNAT family N-acetyltransferase [Longimicrobium sp.]